MLTKREMEILVLITEGLTNQRIAARLKISEHTVKTHLEHMREDLGVHDRAGLVGRAFRTGVLS